MNAIIRPFARSDREQLTDLVNRHVHAVVAGVSLSVNAVMSQLEREPLDAIVIGISVVLTLAILRPLQRNIPLRTLVFRVAMCRLLASASWNEIGNQTGRPASSCASSFKRHHARLIDGHEPYKQTAARVGALVPQAVSGQEWTTGRCAR